LLSLEGLVKVNVIYKKYMKDIGKLNIVMAARVNPTLTFSSIHNDAPYSCLL